MGMPRKLKNFNLFHNGELFAGQVAELTLPKLTRSTEDWRGGGMSGPIKIDFGHEAIQLEWTAGGFMKSVLQQYGALKHDAVLLRFAGGYQGEDSTAYDSVEIVVKGRHTEIDMGTAKAKEDTAFKVTTSASYYKLSVNGETLIELDFVNMIENIGGTDLAASLRTAIGL
ncbi:phage major tail tube protein [Burkholderia gladioli]|uniref:phage major tail tube protein n=1 Tax=Burkholderia gladioli TaxID=28095 RepID=UPI0016407B53|nr:phage major tail tube protein [Burkholderia gladioli]